MKFPPLSLSVLILLTACGSPSIDRETTAEPPPTQKESTVFDPLLEVRDKAKEQAETATRERRDNLDRALESDAQ